MQLANVTIASFGTHKTMPWYDGYNSTVYVYTELEFHEWFFLLALLLLLMHDSLLSHSPVQQPIWIVGWCTRIH